MPCDVSLERFVAAQDAVYPQVLQELRAGAKRSHWMWFVFPQIQGLGHSDMARRYAISSIAEAEAYLSHPVLGQRLRECTRLVMTHADLTAHEIFGSPDDLKFRSCMTLFSRAGSDGKPFQDALNTFFAGEADVLTLARL